MGIFIKLVLCVVMLSIDTCNARAPNAKKRIELTENRLRTLELKAGIHTDDILYNSERISDLNETVLELKTCHHGEQKQNKPNNVPTQGIYEKVNYGGEYIERVIDAFKKEKDYARKNEEIMDKTFREFKTETTKEIETNMLTLNNTAANVKADFADFQVEVKAAFDSLEKEHINEISILNETDTQMIEKINVLQTEVAAAYLLLEKNKDEKINELVIANEIMTTETNQLKQQISQLKETLTSIAGICPYNFTAYNFACYRCFRNSSTYDDAKKTCAKYNAHLVDIQNEEEMNFVIRLDCNIFWLGLTDRETEGTWLWERTGMEAKYQNWRPGQPDSAGGDQDNAVAGWEDPLDQWNDVNRLSTAISTMCKIVPNLWQ